MSQPGFGAMIHYLSGGSQDSASEYYGQKINSAKLADDALMLSLSGGKDIYIWDNGQSCCEHRYMRTDDDVQSLVGHILTKIDVKEVFEKDDEYDTHEICFVEICTDAGSIVISNHNEHNGYYGGFGLTITEGSREHHY